MDNLKKYPRVNIKNERRGKKETLHFLQQIFPLRTCSDTELKSRKRPCIEYEIKRCTAPCCGLIESEDYHRFLTKVDVSKLLSEQKTKIFKKVF